MVDVNTFDEAKSAQKDGVNSVDVGKSLSLTLKEVNKIFSSKDWFEYSGEEKPVLTLDEEPFDRVAPASAGYYRGLVAKKVEENSQLKEQRAWLLEQVYFLRKAVAFLETRKKELERAVESMEKQIAGAIPAIEQLEQNANFTTISPNVIKRNT